MTIVINAREMDALATIVEEGARATPASVKRFVEPARGTLRRARSRRHHIVFGRRGSGKTSLLRKAAADLTVDRRPIAYVDLEPFKGHQYPDVLISSLIESFTSFREWLQTAAVYRSNKKTFWDRLFGTSPKRSALNRTEANRLARLITDSVAELNEQLYLFDNADLTQTTHVGQEHMLHGNLGSELSFPGTAEVKADVSHSDVRCKNTEIQESFRRSKIHFLHRHILEYKDIFKEMARLSDGDAFLFLDDLYHIPRSDQTRLLDYFHRIAKGCNLWLKIGTIRHRSEWYVYGDPPIGLKLGDDADEINLDLTLEKYALAKDFLVKVLGGLIQEAEAPPIEEFLTEGAVDRLVLASGGVARDFLGIFRRSLDIARERLKRDPNHYRGPRVMAEDVNLAAGKYGDTKQEEFKRDTLEDRDRLQEVFQGIRSFCINEANANCFLLDQDACGEGVGLVRELVDLRLIHLVRSRVTVSGRVGKIFKAYLLDVSQYTGARKRRDLEMVEFWRRGSRERLRRISLIYAPSEMGR